MLYDSPSPAQAPTSIDDWLQQQQNTVNIPRDLKNAAHKALMLLALSSKLGEGTLNVIESGRYNQIEFLGKLKKDRLANRQGATLSEAQKEALADLVQINSKVVELNQKKSY